MSYIGPKVDLINIKDALRDFKIYDVNFIKTVISQS